MIDWIGQNSGVLQVALSAVMAVVWLVYLQLFLMSFVRQRRPEILINTGAGSGLGARCFIANLSFEPIYVAELVLTYEADGQRRDALITDREDLSEEQVRDPREATNQGPLKSGDSFDVGAFGDLVARARGGASTDGVSYIGLMVIAVTASSGAPVAATRGYDVQRVEGHRRLVPRDLAARQIRSPLERRRLRRRLEAELAPGSR